MPLRSLPRVRVLVPPNSLVQLWAWVRSADAEGWWACVGWTKSVQMELVLCTGWVAAEQVRPTANETYTDVPRLRLPGQPETWPPPRPCRATIGGPASTTTSACSTVSSCLTPTPASAGYGSVTRTAGVGSPKVPPRHPPKARPDRSLATPGGPGRRRSRASLSGWAQPPLTLLLPRQRPASLVMISLARSGDPRWRNRRRSAASVRILPTARSRPSKPVDARLVLPGSARLTAGREGSAGVAKRRPRAECSTGRGGGGTEDIPG